MEGVNLFDVIHKNLYVIQSEILIHLNIEKPNKINRVSNENYSSALKLSTHVRRNSDVHYVSEKLNCKVKCDSEIITEDICHCSDIDMWPKKYFCEPHDIDCLRRICVGFQCNNHKCLVNNVKCNGVDDCGDYSDEMNCPAKCSESEHICENKCIKKSSLCPTFLFEYNPVNISQKHKEIGDNISMTL
ncbi:Low-density lipoprotein receptor-related protein 2 [Thelohanellus kitauei]|uniref:Low-density lipoprotein receptor-related protein 2 n=1 Tax=Thelohanellus kitauei TaxID=669202 RepID=A0A0C2N5H5_THEKT|nr:Low-density lipoprotein receptor-related protein 2 [Thelohanellus kitauei]